MAAGDKIISFSNLANNGFMNINAIAGGEATIHNIFAPEGSTFAVYMTQASGANSVLVGTYTSSLLGQVFHTQDKSNFYVDVKNTSGAAANFMYSGVVTK